MLFFSLSICWKYLFLMKRSQTRDLLPTSITLSDLASLPDVIKIVENITHPRIPSLRKSVKISRVYTSRVSSKLLTLIGGWTWRNKKIGVIKRDTIIKLSKDEEVFELLSATQPCYLIFDVLEQWLWQRFFITMLSLSSFLPLLSFE